MCFPLPSAKSIAPDLSPLAGKLVLLTGATGLIGSNMFKRIKAAGAKVAFTPSPCSADGMFDFTIHAAGYGQPAKFMADPMKTITVNTVGTMEAVEVTKDAGKFLFLSSSEIYSGAMAPYCEDQIGKTTPEHPRSCYIEGKRCGEAIVNAARGRGLDAKSARVCLVYGPGVKLNDDRIMSIMIRQALTERRIVLRYNSEDLRTYCYIDDAVDMLLNILLYGKMPVYNVGAPLGWSTHTVGEIAALIAEKLGVIASAVIGGKPLPGAPSEVRVDIGRYEAEFGTRPFVPLSVGLDHTIDHFRTMLLSP
jgi:UDP-glucuronate decarboxylase